MRTTPHVYQDPLDLIWLRAADRLHMRVQRDATVFAAWDGAGVLRIGVEESLDADDSLGQMILHELCHALVEGPDAFHLPDWGLEVDRPDHVVHEHACLRLQAALTEPYGLRRFFATTTDFREHYDRLPPDPLADIDDPAVPLAAAGWQRAHNGPWAETLREALGATATIARVLAAVAPPGSLWSVVTRGEES